MNTRHSKENITCFKISHKTLTGATQAQALADVLHRNNVVWWKKRPSVPKGPGDVHSHSLICLLVAVSWQIAHSRGVPTEIIRKISISFFTCQLFEKKSVFFCASLLLKINLGINFFWILGSLRTCWLFHSYELVQAPKSKWQVS